jgi:cytochrome c-type biogenesis protein CcmH/NrfG
LRRALRLSPGRADYWLIWGERLQAKLESGELDRGYLLEKATQAYRIAIELAPENLYIRDRAADFSAKQKNLPEHFLRQVLPEKSGSK